MSNLQQNLKFPALQAVLGKIKFWLSSSYPPQIMLAMPTKEEFETQQLPAHCKVTPRQLSGRRILVQEKERYESPLHSTLAYWPEDALVEGMRSILVIVLEGTPKLHFADYSVSCRPGDIIMAPAQIPRFSGRRPPHEKVTESSPFDLMVVFYGPHDPERINMRISRFYNGEDSPARPEEVCWIKSTFIGQMLIGTQEYLEKGNTDNDCAISLLKGLLMLLRREISDGDALNNLLPADSLHVIHQNPIEKALEYTNNHFDKHLSIDTVARWVGLSRSVFTRQFRAETGQSFTQYLTQKRLDRAKELLTETRLPVTRISEKCAISPEHLRRLFRKKYQCSPRQFRTSQKHP